MNTFEFTHKIPMQGIAARLLEGGQPIRDAEAHAVQGAHLAAGCPRSCFHHTVNMMVPNDVGGFDLQVVAECHPNAKMWDVIRDARQRGRDEACEGVLREPFAPDRYQLLLVDKDGRFTKDAGRI